MQLYRNFLNKLQRSATPLEVLAGYLVCLDHLGEFELSKETLEKLRSEKDVSEILTLYSAMKRTLAGEFLCQLCSTAMLAKLFEQIPERFRAAAEHFVQELRPIQKFAITKKG